MRLEVEIMITEQVEALIGAAIIVALGVVVGIGKGDWLIAGYNTSSQERRKRVNIERLRLLVMVLSLAIGATLFISSFSSHFEVIVTSVVLVLTVVYLVLANTWAKRKE